MKRALCGLLAIMVLSAIAVGDDKSKDKDKDKEKAEDKVRVYDAPFDKVWTACVASANENFVIEHSDKDSGILNFHSGTSLTSNGFRVGVVVMKTDDEKVRVQLNTQKKKQLFAWGAGGRISDKFFKGVERFLKEGKAKV